MSQFTSTLYTCRSPSKLYHYTNHSGTLHDVRWLTRKTFLLKTLAWINHLKLRTVTTRTIWLYTNIINPGNTLTLIFTPATICFINYIIWQLRGSINWEWICPSNSTFDPSILNSIEWDDMEINSYNSDSHIVSHLPENAQNIIYTDTKLNAGINTSISIPPNTLASPQINDNTTLQQLLIHIHAATVNTMVINNIPLQDSFTTEVNIKYTINDSSTITSIVINIKRDLPTDNPAIPTNIHDSKRAPVIINRTRINPVISVETIESPTSTVPRSRRRYTDLPNNTNARNLHKLTFGCTLSDTYASTSNTTNITNFSCSETDKPGTTKDIIFKTNQQKITDNLIALFTSNKNILASQPAISYDNLDSIDSSESVISKNLEPDISSDNANDISLNIMPRTKNTSL